MTLDQIQVIDIIVKSGSFSAAAQELNKAQSAISYAVKNIEEDWGIKIFDRDSYRAKLTPAGEAILGKVQAVLKNVESLNLQAKQLSKTLEPILRITINNLFPMTMIMPVLTQFKKQFPNTQLQLAVDHMEEPSNKLLAGEADLAITVKTPHISEIETKDLYDVQLVGVTAKNYIQKKNITHADLTSKTQIIVSSQNQDQQSHKAGIIDGANQWVVTDLATKNEMILKGLGFGYMPTYMVSKHLQTGRLTKIQCMNKVDVPIKIQRRVTDPMGPAKSFIWNASV